MTHNLKTLRLMREIPTLQEYREVLELFGSQSEMAKAFGVSRWAISRWHMRLESKERVERRGARK